ncbi:unnamed protein product, partial [Scytosiphon promiscuus]
EISTGCIRSTETLAPAGKYREQLLCVCFLECLARSAYPRSGGEASRVPKYTPSAMHGSDPRHECPFASRFFHLCCTGGGRRLVAPQMAPERTRCVRGFHETGGKG